jgi:hypothetical protein
MEPEGSLPHSQAPATFLYPEPPQSSTYPHILLLEYPSNIILPSTPGFPQWSLSLRFPHKNPVQATGGTVSNMEGSYDWISGRGQPTRCGSPAWGLVEGISTPHRENVSLIRNVTGCGTQNYHRTLKNRRGFRKKCGLLSVDMVAQPATKRDGTRRRPTEPDSLSWCAIRLERSQGHGRTPSAALPSPFYGRFTTPLQIHNFFYHCTRSPFVPGMPWLARCSRWNFLRGTEVVYRNTYIVSYLIFQLFIHLFLK